MHTDPDVTRLIDTRPERPDGPGVEDVIAGPGRSRWWVGAATRVTGPLAAAVVTFILAHSGSAPFEAAALALLSMAAGGFVVGREPRWTGLLPFAGALTRASGPLLGAGLLILLERAGLVAGLENGEVWLVALISVSIALVAGLAIPAVARPSQPTRIAVIGSSRSTDSLARELQLSDHRDFEIVGRVSVGEGTPSRIGEVPWLGRLDELGAAVERNKVDLLLMTGEAPRMAVFEEVARSCLNLPVRLRELSGFYEEVFGHVPVAEINAAWFQWIVHPRYRAKRPPSDRALDLVIAGATLVVSLPLLALMALIIRRDGGPVFFKQTRIGEFGRPFTIYKLRTMREGASAQWATAEDARVTGIGRILRKTHLDELPQVLNVLKGEMSVVGPRPEQPAFVDRLETVVPFYQRRHLMKPGLTGWAQVRCGYAGSEVGSAWKVCHDLYYLKHRSLGLNLVILLETVRTLVADAQYTAEPASVDFILAPTRTPIEALDASASVTS